MFPETKEISFASSSGSYGTKSFLFDFETGDFVVRDGKLIECDGIEAVKVWIEKILRTEKGRFKIYDNTEYGAKLEDLIIGNSYSVAFISKPHTHKCVKPFLHNICEIVGRKSFIILFIHLVLRHIGQLVSVTVAYITGKHTVSVL